MVKNYSNLLGAEVFRELENLYIFENSKEIKDFLLNNAYLIDILFEAHKQIKRVFGEHIVGVCLRYYRDSEENFGCVSVNVSTNLSPESSLDFLRRFDEEWWSDVSDEFRGLLEVMVGPLGFEDLLTHEQKIRKLKAVRKYFGILSDLTPEQWQQYLEATKRRPFFKKRGRNGY